MLMRNLEQTCMHAAFIVQEGGSKVHAKQPRCSVQCGLLLLLILPSLSSVVRHS
jgi:hypothetical protein